MINKEDLIEDIAVEAAVRAIKEYPMYDTNDNYIKDNNKLRDLFVLAFNQGAQFIVNKIERR